MANTFIVSELSLVLGSLCFFLLGLKVGIEIGIEIHNLRKELKQEGKK